MKRARRFAQSSAPLPPEAAQEQLRIETQTRERPARCGDPKCASTRFPKTCACPPDASFDP
jgi:hypothetical protein